VWPGNAVKQLQNTCSAGSSLILVLFWGEIAVKQLQNMCSAGENEGIGNEMKVMVK